LIGGENSPSGVHTYPQLVLALEDNEHFPAGSDKGSSGDLKEKIDRERRGHQKIALQETTKVKGKV